MNMTCIQKRLSRILLSISLTLSFGALSAGQSLVEGGPRSIVAFESRPLAAVILELEMRYGWVVTYEDPPYEAAKDREDVTSMVRRDGKWDKKVFVPRQKLFAFDYQNRDVTRPGELLAALLTDYNNSGNDDEFKLITSGSTFHVVPASNLNAFNARVARSSRLDTRVTVAHSDRDVFATIEEVLQQVRSPSGGRVVAGMMPTNLVLQSRVSIGAQQERARDVLERTLAATGVNLSWQLFCAPGVDGQCALNLHRVAAVAK